MSLKSNQEFSSTYESDVKLSINVTRLLSIVVGLWPIDFNKFPIKATIKLLINVLSSVLMMSVITSNVLCAIFEMENLYEKLQIAGPTFFYTMSFLKYLLIIFYGGSIKKCFKHLKEDWMLIDTREKRELMLKNAKFGKFLSILSATFMFGGGFGHHLFNPLLSESIMTEMNISVKPFPSPVYWKMFNTGYSPLYECVFCAVLTADFFLISTAAVSFNLPAILIIHACGQFEIVIIYLHNLVNGLKDDKSTAQERFVVIMKSHLRVLSFVAQLEKLFSGLFLVEIMSSSITLCLLGYYAIENWKFGNIATSLNFAFLLVGFVYTLFVYCYVGELLTMQAGKVGETGYMIDWYHLPKNTLQDLLFFIRICQLPSKITAGKVFFISLATFSTLMKSSMAYLNLIWKIT